jgi:hypothetical protein
MIGLLLQLFQLCFQLFLFTPRQHPSLPLLLRQRCQLPTLSLSLKSFFAFEREENPHLALISSSGTNKFATLASASNPVANKLAYHSSASCSSDLPSASPCCQMYDLSSPVLLILFTTPHLPRFWCCFPSVPLYDSLLLHKSQSGFFPHF